MEQKQVIAHQLELFDINGEVVVYHFPKREVVSGTQRIKDLQINTAGKQERALVWNIQPSTKTAVYESTHGGVRGRGSNPPTYSIGNHILPSDASLWDAME